LKEISHVQHPLQSPAPCSNPRLGFYSNGIHVTTPLIFDTGNEKAQVYREHFRRKYSEEPDWISAFSYDSALLLVEAILQSNVMPDEEHKLIETISKSTKNLLYILNDILDLSKIEDGKLNLNLVSFELTTLFKQVVTTMSPNAEKKGLKLRYLLDNDVPIIIDGDQVRFRQILMNLLSNAIKFTEQGEISIQARKIGLDDGIASLEFLVKDSGIGISPEKLSIIFEPFVQADSSTSRSQHGTGLGLSICKHLVDMMGGSIEVQSTLGVGSVFRVVLPFKEVTAISEHKQAQNVRAPLPLSILMVEDEPVSQVIVASLLSDEGLTLNILFDGEMPKFEHA
jgi:two-component system, sensor histidine kinase